jgi:hypothetical protein
MAALQFLPQKALWVHKVRKARGIYAVEKLCGFCGPLGLFFM